MFGSEKYDGMYNRIRNRRSKTCYHRCFFSLSCKNQSSFLWSFAYRTKLILHNFIIQVKPNLNEDQNHYYYKIILEKCLYQPVKNNGKKFFDSIIMLRFGETKVAKEKFHGAKIL